MFGLLIRKWFYDFWDSLIKLVPVNLVYLLAGAGASTAVFFILNATPPYVSIPVLAVLLFIINVYSSMTSSFSLRLCNYEQAGFREFFGSFRQSLMPALFLTIAGVIQFVIVVIVLPMYMSMGSGGQIIAYLAGGVIFWGCIFFWLVMQYFLPFYWQMDRSIRKALRKSAIVMLDNTLFTIGLAIGGLLIFAVSLITFFLLPGAGAIYMWQQTALKLRMLKYDYLEENPEANRKKIPWEVLIAPEKEKVGTRSFRNLIFPWKD